MREALVVCATTYGIDDLREEQKASPLANISQQDHVNLPFSETRIMFLDLFDLSCLSLFENGDLALIRIQEPTALESCRTAQVSKIGFGCMGLSGIYSSPVPDEDVVAIIKTAFDAGVTFFDTGDAYWPHNNEDMLGKMSELKKLVEEGKVKYIGLPEATIDTIKAPSYGSSYHCTASVVCWR
ncbi:perakine reductase-like isoform X2 [Phragmites australis]|uniref:perakine reductase-like isoform X2 n=1 Tax=Phragmites australis TaxID=29695 RepID=UPI002D76A55D|nr:perakine reductase-like isoform X2 [Phragmites australis]